ncbi:Arm DNA-binding domain-containing protein [Pontibacter burrus]|uniref:Arm DNA-binding domain-containing protein n=1 Tax=Pontibacter burrus TaxID=2704466 RepID=A0A6B3LKH1_9BACT|nr:Arm DNA-binding domain-containing protein [Pontibacter burrus]NEM97422.1 hypothetical protein [Pontibacter burrus]
MDTRISILFYDKESKLTRNGFLPIYLRVTISGQRFETITHRHVRPVNWLAEAGKVKGNSEHARSVNAYLDTLRAQVYSY